MNFSVFGEDDGTLGATQSSRRSFNLTVITFTSFNPNYIAQILRLAVPLTGIAYRGVAVSYMYGYRTWNYRYQLSTQRAMTFAQLYSYAIRKFNQYGVSVYLGE